HRVFRIRTLSAFCDEVDRLARCVQDGDLARALRGDVNAPTRLRLATKQLTFVLQSVDNLLG
ncbi:MAG: chromosome partitioning protein ParB, partial [Chloroflexota bacterium]|nr:chromosome partitioning protein ParB [Chloroflexota bacterium]